MPPTVTIDSLSFGGAGVGRQDGKVVFVPLTAPGDQVTFRAVREKKNFCEAELVSLHVPSPQRISPACPVFGECGGCQWQHLPYPVQALWKERIFRDMLVRQLGVTANLIRPILAADAPWHYRSRVQFKCRMTAQGFVMGFYRPGSHFVVDVESCPIADPQINSALTILRQFLPTTPYVHQIPQVDLSVGDEGGVRAVVHFIGEDVAGCIGRLKDFGQQHDLDMFVQTGRKASLQTVHGEELLSILVDEPPIRLSYGPGGFAQVNLEQNRRLVEAVVQTVTDISPERVLDLYCGMGNFTLPLARRVPHIRGVEEFAPAIDQARRNAEVNDISSVHFQACAAEEFFSTSQGQTDFDLILLDPPRSGAYSLCKQLGSSTAGHILYVSCDPSTLVRDLKSLLHNGFDLVWSRPVDLFPQTYHIESLTLLRRSDISC